jgi:hypothetical protein
MSMKKYLLPAALALLSACTNKALLELCQANNGYVEATRPQCLKKTCATITESCNETIQPKPQVKQVSKNDVVVHNRKPTLIILKTCERVRCDCIEYQYEKYNRCSEV